MMIILTGILLGGLLAATILRQKPVKQPVPVRIDDRPLARR